MNSLAKDRTNRTARRAAWLTWAVTMALLLVGLWLTRLNRLAPERYLAEFILPVMLGGLAYATVGALITARRPANRIGLLLAVTGLSEGVMMNIHQYARYTLVTNPGAGLPGGELLAWLNIWIWVPQSALFVVFLPLLFPDGRLPSPRWRWALWLVIAALVALTFTVAITPGPIDNSLAEVQNPYVPAWSASVLPWLTPLAAALTLAALAVAVAAPVARLRRAVGGERQQMKWFAFAAGIMVLCYLIPIAYYYPVFTEETWLSGLLLTVGVPVVPVAVGMAVLRYRLYEIDFLIRRTLIYSALTVALALVYLASVLVLQQAFRTLTGSTSALAVVASTLLMAALFSPLRGRIQHTIDRLFYRQKYDAGRVLAEFSAQAAAEVDLERLSALLAQNIEQSIQPESVSIWMKKG